MHIRDADHRPDARPGAGCATRSQALREQTSLIVQLSTGGSVHDPLEQRLKVLDAEPDSCSLTCGTTNFGNDVFLNPYPFMEQLYQQAQEREVVPEFELFDLGHVASMRRLIDTYGLPYGGRVHVDFVTGVPGRDAGYDGGPGRRRPGAAARGHLVVGHRHRPHPPADHGGGAVDGRPPAGGHGGQPRPSPAGMPVRDNAQLVERAADLTRTMQRPPLTTDEARSLLAIKERRRQRRRAPPQREKDEVTA